MCPLEFGVKSFITDKLWGGHYQRLPFIYHFKLRVKDKNQDSKVLLSQNFLTSLNFLSVFHFLLTFIFQVKQVIDLPD